MQGKLQYYCERPKAFQPKVRRCMNIFFTGSHGTGKTTTALEIEKMSEFNVAPSASRMSPHRQGTIEHQEFVMDRVYRRCATWDNYVHERTPFDVYAYTVEFGLNSAGSRQKMKIDSFVRSVNHQGNILFYFPIRFDLILDGTRPGKSAQISVDKTISDQIKRTGVNYRIVPDGTPQERADFILKEVSNAKL